jgi:hypothetical protein
MSRLQAPSKGPLAEDRRDWAAEECIGTPETLGCVIQGLDAAYKGQGRMCQRPSLYNLCRGLATCAIVPGARCPVSGARCQVPDARCQVVTLPVSNASTSVRPCAIVAR